MYGEGFASSKTERERELKMGWGVGMRRGLIVTEKSVPRTKFAEFILSRSKGKFLLGMTCVLCGHRHAERHARLIEISSYFTRPRLAVLATFTAFFIAGLFAFDDYGISSDEPMALWFGYHTYGYLFLGRPPPDFPDWSFYGPAWHTFLAIGNELIGSPGGRVMWLFRHFLNFSLFFAGIIAFYFLAKRCVKNWTFALLAAAFLMLSPRMFAHAFTNPKDLPAMVFFLFAIATMFVFLERRSMVTAALHALCCGLIISMRMFGLIVPLLTIAFLILPPLLSNPRSRNDVSRSLRDAGVYLLLLCLLTIAVWPVLWDANPLTRFLDAFTNTSSRQGGGFYFGQLVTANPWHYLPVWIFITTPVLYSLAFVIGCMLVLRDIFRNPLNALREKTDLTLLAWFFLPVAALLLLRIGIFDEWRHVLFIYPAFLLIGMRGLEWALGKLHEWRTRIGSRVLTGIIALSMLSTAWWMISRHPFQYMYFSIPSRFVQGNFELDYWSLGSRAGLQWILDHDRTPVVKVYPAGRITRIASDLLPLNGWARIEWTDPDKADYIVDNFRANKYIPTLPEEKKIHSIVVDDLNVITIYRGPDTKGIYKPHLWLEDQVPLNERMDSQKP